MIPKTISVKNNALPDEPGVYFYFDKNGLLLYIGKATSLKRRVESYFNKAHDRRIEQLVSEIVRIDYTQTQTVIEALVLEANEIKRLRPKYNILQRDDKSYLYLCVTNEDFPHPELIRGHELKRLGINPFAKTLSPAARKKFLAVFGPYVSGPSLKRALALIRPMIPWSICTPDKPRPCFDAQIRKCPGVCVGAITKREYRSIMRNFVLFFEGKKPQLIRKLTHEMNAAAKNQAFERATTLRNQLFALEHIRDITLITREDEFPLVSKKEKNGSIDLEGRIEAYDISNISGTSATGSMVVFEEGQPAKAKYRKFKIKTVVGPNDVAMMEEIMRRRLKRAQRYPAAWPLPELMVIDGGKPQVNRVQQVLDEYHVNIPIVGLAKGPDRKQDVLIFDRENRELAAVVHRGKNLFQRARDEAHRFAVKYHRQLRSKRR